MNCPEREQIAGPVKGRDPKKSGRKYGTCHGAGVEERERERERGRKMRNKERKKRKRDETKKKRLSKEELSTA